jgi:hypothetical protein
VIEMRDRRVVLYPGGYDDYESARVARERETEEPKARGPQATKPAAADAPGKRDRAAGDPPRKRARGVAPAAGADAARPGARSNAGREREIRRVEKDIEGRESKIRELEAQLADPGTYREGERARALLGEYERLRAEVQALWQRLAEL